MGNETKSGGADGEWVTTSDPPADREPLEFGLTNDVAFDLLSVSHRRFVLYCLHRHDGGIDLQRLTERVARLFEEAPARTVPEHDRLRSLLAHTTLPRLADADVIVYDRDVNLIWPTRRIDSMGPLLELSAVLDFDTELASL